MPHKATQTSPQKHTARAKCKFEKPPNLGTYSRYGKRGDGTNNIANNQDTDTPASTTR